MLGIRKFFVSLDTSLGITSSLNILKALAASISDKCIIGPESETALRLSATQTPLNILFYSHFKALCFCLVYKVAHSASYKLGLVCIPSFINQFFYFHNKLLCKFCRHSVHFNHLKSITMVILFKTFVLVTTI